MSTEENTRVVLRLFEEVFNERRLDRADELVEGGVRAGQDLRGRPAVIAPLLLSLAACGGDARGEAGKARANNGGGGGPGGPGAGGGGVAG